MEVLSFDGEFSGGEAIGLLECIESLFFPSFNFFQSTE